MAEPLEDKLSALNLGSTCGWGPVLGLRRQLGAIAEVGRAAGVGAARVHRAAAAAAVDGTIQLETYYRPIGRD